MLYHLSQNLATRGLKFEANQDEEGFIRLLQKNKDRWPKLNLGKRMCGQLSTTDQYASTAANLDMSSVIAENDEPFSTLIEQTKEPSPTRDPK